MLPRKFSQREINEPVRDEFNAPQSEALAKCPVETIPLGLRHGKAPRLGGEVGYFSLHKGSHHLLDEGEEGSE